MQFFIHTIEAQGHAAPLRCYIPDAAPMGHYQTDRPAVIVFPGGGYAITYAGEAEPIALGFAAAGICAFVPDYSCMPVRFPVQLLQGLCAVRYVRDNAEKFGIDPHNIGTLGFSAGGHLCATVGTLWKHGCIDGMLPDEQRSLYRPDKLFLCYPVISAGEACDVESFANLLGHDALRDRELMETVSAERQVDTDTPPAFLWHTAEDNGVSVRNSLEFALALACKGVGHELHVYPHGDHGLCLGNHVTGDVPFGAGHVAQAWLGDAIRFAYDTEILHKKES